MKKIVKLVALCSLVLIFGTLLSCQQTGQFFTVKFFDGDNNLIDTQRVKRAVAPKHPKIRLKKKVYLYWMERRL